MVELRHDINHIYITFFLERSFLDDPVIPVIIARSSRTCPDGRRSNHRKRSVVGGRAFLPRGFDRSCSSPSAVGTLRGTRRFAKHEDRFSNTNGLALAYGARISLRPAFRRVPLLCENFSVPLKAPTALPGRSVGPRLRSPDAGSAGVIFGISRN